MSYVTIFGIAENGEVYSHDSVNNNHCFAPLVWQFLTVQYGIHPTGSPMSMPTPYGYDELWGMLGENKLERLDEILLGATLDRVWVGRDLIPDLIVSMRNFHTRYIAPRKYTPTIKEAAECIESLMNEMPTNRGVAFNMCSAVQDFWHLPVDADADSEDEPGYRELNIDSDPNCYDGKPHWQLKV